MMGPGFDSRTRWDVWVEFVGSRFCSERLLFSRLLRKTKNETPNSLKCLFCTKQIECLQQKLLPFEKLNQTVKRQFLLLIFFISHAVHKSSMWFLYVLFHLPSHHFCSWQVQKLLLGNYFPLTGQRTTEYYCVQHWWTKRNRSSISFQSTGQYCNITCWYWRFKCLRGTMW